MIEGIKIIDGRINIPRAIKRQQKVLTAQEAIEEEKVGGRGGLLELFTGMAERKSDGTDRVQW